MFFEVTISEMAVINKVYARIPSFPFPHAFQIDINTLKFTMYSLAYLI
jgi:hypothetical protein